MITKQYLVDRRTNRDRRNDQSLKTQNNPTVLTEESFTEKRTQKTDRRSSLPSNDVMVFDNAKELLAFFTQIDIDISTEVNAEFNESGHVKQVVLH